MARRSNRLAARWARLALLAGLIVVVALWHAGKRAVSLHEDAAIAPLEALGSSDRVLILAPHPDDEVLGCGGIIQEAVAKHLPLRIVFLTYGDNNQWSFLVYRKHPVLDPTAVRRMGLIRHDEALVAAQALGVAPEQLTFLGYPDFGTMQMWKSHWGDRPPFASMLTRVTAVPYPNALHPGAPYTGESILADLTAILREFRPTKAFVSHSGDHMPDHAALYLFTQVALWDLDGELRPTLYPYLIHFRRWPARRGFRPDDPLSPPALFRDAVVWQTYPLTPLQVARTRTAILAHRSQYLASASYLLSFIRRNELFGDFPPVVLEAGAALVQPSHGAPGEGALEPTEQLTEEERAAFVGVETRSVERSDETFTVGFEFSRPLGRAVNASVYLFGYRHDQPFATMPKLHVQLGPLTHAVFDQDERLPSQAVRVVRRARTVSVTVPLRLLGDPQRVLVSARTYFGEIPLDWASWRVVELPQRRPVDSARDGVRARAHRAGDVL